MQITHIALDPSTLIVRESKILNGEGKAIDFGPIERLKRYSTGWASVIRVMTQRPRSGRGEGVCCMDR